MDLAAVISPMPLATAFAAYRELVRWIAAEYDFTEIDAYMLFTQAGRARLGNMEDPKYRLGASISKSLLA